jgi:PAT family beta-lactamase induction signal transducer AmpG
MFAGQYLGIVLGGGTAIFVSGLVGFQGALAFVSLLLLANLAFVLLFVRDPGVQPPRPRAPGFFQALVTKLVAFVKEVYASFWKSGRGPILGTAFSLLPCGAMALAYALLATMQVDYGLSTNQIASLQVWNTIAAAVGCLIGGVLGDRYGVKRVVAAGFAMTAVITFGLASQISQHGLTGVALTHFVGSVLAHGFFFGVAYGSRNAIFMGMTNPAVAATQFTAFMGMSNMAISFGNYWQGAVAERMGYATVLYIDAAIVLLVLALIPFLREREIKPPDDLVTVGPAVRASAAAAVD